MVKYTLLHGSRIAHISRYFSPRRLVIVLGLALPFFLETLWHVRSLQTPRPQIPLDEPFQIGCEEPDVHAPRENATLIMLARNEDLAGAKLAMQNIEDRFNRWFHYPIVFLNDREWTTMFKTELSSIASGKITFDTLTSDQWGYPDSVDQQKARESMKEQASNGILYAEHESYHHMCRFYSGYALPPNAISAQR